MLHLGCECVLQLAVACRATLSMHLNFVCKPILVDDLLGILEAWVGVEYPKWFEEDGGKGFIVTQGDPESDMALGNVEIVDPAMVGSDASTFAHDIVDFSDVIPGSQPHPAVAHYANKARFRSEPPAAKTTKKRKAATASPQTVVEDELVATDGLLEEGKQGGWHG